MHKVCFGALSAACLITLLVATEFENPLDTGYSNDFLNNFKFDNANNPTAKTPANTKTVEKIKNFDFSSSDANLDMENYQFKEDGVSALKGSRSFSDEQRLWTTDNLKSNMQGITEGTSIKMKGDNKDNYSNEYLKKYEFNGGNLEAKASMYPDACSDGRTVNFLSVSYSGSDNISATYRLDTDLDGSVDRSWSFSGISGICANGFVKCPAGAWGDKNRCSHFKFEYKNSTLLAKQVEYSEVGGCMVTNTANKEALASRNKEQVLSMLAAPVYSLVGNAAGVVVSVGQMEGGSFVYKAASRANMSNECINLQNPPQPPNANEDLEELGKQNAMLQKANDPTGAYTVLDASESNSNYKEDLAFESGVQSTTLNISTTTTYTDSNNMVSFDYTDTAGARQSGKFIIDNGYEAQYCKVAYKVIDTAGFTDGSHRGTTSNSYAKDYTTDTGHATKIGQSDSGEARANTMEESEIRECKEEPLGSKNYVCPTSPGEVVVKKCGEAACAGGDITKCNEDLLTVLSLFSAVEEATEDMTCAE